MGDLGNPKETPISLLPPGFRFRPTEEQLFSYYLTNKNKYRNCHLSLPVSSSASISVVSILDFNAIREIDLFSYDPCDLPEISCFPFGRGGNRKHWYCFTESSVNEGLKRKARGGFWKRRSRVRDVVVGGYGGTVLGKRKTFLFYRGSTFGPKKTDWVMYEYSLVDHHDQKDSFVLCRVFNKSCGVNKTSEPTPISYADERIGEVAKVEDTFMDVENEIQRFMTTLVSQPDNEVVTSPVSDDGLQLSKSIRKQEELVRSSNGITSTTMEISNALPYKLLNSSTLDENFLELDDLDIPLPCNDSSG